MPDSSDGQATDKAASPTIVKRARGRRPVTVEVATHNANSRLAIFLICLVALAPLPLGSNRPAFWALSALALGVAVVIYATGLIWSRGILRTSASSFGALGWLFLALCAFVVVQIVPLGPLSGIATFVAIDGGRILSQTLSISPDDTLLALMQLVGYGLFLFLMIQVSQNRGRALRLLQVLFLIAVVYAIYGIIALTQLDDTLLFMEKWAYQGVATGPFVNRNSYATFLAMGATVGSSLIMRQFENPRKSRHRSGRWFTVKALTTQLMVLGWGVVIAAVFLSRSRMGLVVAMIGSAVVVAIWLGRRRTAGSSSRRWLVAPLTIVAIIMASAFGAGTLERLGSTETDLDFRVTFYQQVWEMIMLRPWFGYGAGSFEVAFPLVHQPPVSVDLLWDKAHNTYLSLWAEFGLIAGTIPLVIFGILGLGTFRAAISRGRDFAAPAAAFASIVLVAVHSLVDFSIEIQANVYFLLALIGLGVGGKSPTAAKPEGQ